MEMWLRHPTLVLLTAALAGVVASGVTRVDLETQRNVNIPFGSFVVLDCPIMPKTNHRFEMKLHFNSSGSTNNTHIVLINKTIQQHNKTTQQDNGIFNISSFTQENNGWYFCEITKLIPVYKIATTKGTQLITKSFMENTTYPSVMTSKQANPTEDHPGIEWWMWILLGVSAFILITLLIICIILRRRYRRSREPEPIYVNTRPVVLKQPSPRPETSASNLKTTSASENLRTTPSLGRRYEESKRKQRR